MLLAYKDRAKEKLEGADGVLSPSAGFVELPTGQDFEYAAVLADGRWQTGVANVTLDGGNRVFSLVEVYASSEGIGESLDVNWLDMAATPAEVFCTITADTMRRLDAVIQRLGDSQTMVGQLTVGSSSTETATVEPVWPGHETCEVAYVQYDFNVFAWRGSQPIAKAWSGTAVFSGAADPAVSTQVMVGAENVDLGIVVNIDTGSGRPVLSLEYSNADASFDYKFKAEVVATRIDHPSSCW